MILRHARPYYVVMCLSVARERLTTPTKVVKALRSSAFWLGTMKLASVSASVLSFVEPDILQRSPCRKEEADEEQ